MENKTQKINSRRAFLKKAAYSAPMVIGLGALTLPSRVGASTFVHNTISATSGGITSTSHAYTLNGTNIVASGDYINVPNFPTNSSYTISGTDVKNQALAGNQTWAWVDDIYGGTNWTGQ
jgi:hypothetical protein